MNRNQPATPAAATENNMWTSFAAPAMGTIAPITAGTRLINKMNAARQIRAPSPAPNDASAKGPPVAT